MFQTAGVEGMVHSNAAALLQEINTKMQRIRLAAVSLWVLLPLVLVLLLLGWLIASIVAAVVALSAWIGCRSLDRRRKTIELEYNLDPEFDRCYRALLQAAWGLWQSKRIWHVPTSTAVIDRKYHGGAAHSVRRVPIRLEAGVPLLVRSNVKAPIIPAGHCRLYFFPDMIFIQSGSRMGAVGYDELQIDSTTTQFIEDQAPPSDATQVGTTWRYVNRSGGPDRRFRDNRQIPVMEYGLLHLRTQSGLNELLHVSSANAASSFAATLSDLAHLERAAKSSGVRLQA